MNDGVQYYVNYTYTGFLVTKFLIGLFGIPLLNKRS